MAKDLNKMQLTGRLGADPELRYTAQGNAVTTFRVASNRRWTASDGTQHEETEWFRVVAWNKLGEVCARYLAKGARVYVEGRIQTRSWEDQDGQKRATTEVVAIDMIILDSRREGGDELELEVGGEEAEPSEMPEPETALATKKGRRTQRAMVEEEAVPF
jgi:single-strand DNA-binding protein